MKLIKQSSLNKIAFSDTVSGIDEKIKYLSIDDFGFSIRVLNCLKRLKIFTIGQLSTLNDEQLMKIRNIGEVSINEIHDKLSQVISLPKEKINKINSQYKLLLYRELGPPFFLLRFDLGLIVDLFIDNPRVSSILNRYEIFTIGDLIINWDLINRFSEMGGTTYKKIVDSLREPVCQPENMLSYEYIQSVIENVGDHPLTKTSLPTIIKDILLENGLTTILDVITNFHLLNSKYKIEYEDRKEIISHISYWLRNPDHVCSKEILIDPLSKGVSKHDQELDPQEGVRLFLSSLSERNFQIISDLYGFFDANPKTLRVVSDRYAVSRERVRQIKLNAIRKVSNLKSYNYLMPFLGQIYKLAQKQGGLISESKLSLLTSEILPELIIHIAPFLRFIFETQIEKSCKLPVLFIKEINGYSIEDYSKDSILGILNKLMDILNQESIPLQRDELLDKLIKSRGFSAVEEGLAFTVCSCAKDVGILSQMPNGVWSNRKKKLTREEMITITLNQIGKPEHFEVITEELNRLFPENQKTPHHINYVLQANTDAFARVGMGTYGLVEWGLLNDGNIANTIWRVIKEAKTSLSYQEIKTIVLEIWKVGENSIYMALQRDARFKKNNDGKYSLSKFGIGRGKLIKRYDANRLSRIIQVLEKFGYPVHYSNITKEHNKLFPDWPLTYLNIYHVLGCKKDIFIRTYQGTYGLRTWGITEYRDPDYCEDLTKKTKYKKGRKTPPA